MRRRRVDFEAARRELGSRCLRGARARGCRREARADEYRALQAVVHGVGRAICRAVPTERLYVLSLGSSEGNSHVHWHLARSRPECRSSGSTRRARHRPRLELGDDELDELAGRIRAALAETGKEPPGA
jgi:diadenosine tetraphosphate (Ap4A) HIT family hydrolase